MFYIVMDIHKICSSVEVVDEKGVLVDRHRANHRLGE